MSGPLVSNLFRNSKKLQKTAVSDPDHLLRGSKGEAVSLVHRALVAIDTADISEEEIRNQLYGDTTVREVLKYKVKRNIINPAYQTQADSVVGKMTIVSLDREMAIRESQNAAANLFRSGEIV